MSEREPSLNLAASRPRMFIALAVLLVLGVLSWLTIDSSAVLHVQGFSSRVVAFGPRTIEIRWLPILFLGLFAFKVVLANMRARLETRDPR
jgi:hypothetical protein